MTLADTRVVFMGTPHFAVPSLNALVDARANIVGIVTQPDKPAGRGQRLHTSAIALRAQELGLRVFKPGSLKQEDQRRFLWELKPDLLVVVSFGQILPKAVLDLPRFGAVNVHASILPKYRGPAPIPAAILAGDTETGVTIMKLDEGVDTGPVLACEPLRIAPDDTTGSLTEKLALLGARLLVPTLERYIQHELSPATRPVPRSPKGIVGSLGEVWPTPQNDAEATRCRFIKKAQGTVDWTQPAASIARMVRAYDPWPRAYTMWNGKRLILRKATPLQTSEVPLLNFGSLQVGTVVRAAQGVGVATGDGLLQLEEVQLEGRSSQVAGAFVRGYPNILHDRLGIETPKNRFHQ